MIGWLLFVIQNVKLLAHEVNLVSNVFLVDSLEPICSGTLYIGRLSLHSRCLDILDQSPNLYRFWNFVIALLSEINLPSKRIELSKITLFHATPSLPNEAKGNDDKKIHITNITIGAWWNMPQRLNSQKIITYHIFTPM